MAWERPLFRTAWLWAAFALLLLFACHVENPSEAGSRFSFPTLKDKIGSADHVTILLEDSSGHTLDVLFDGPADSATSFMDLKAEHYEGGKVFIHIEARKGEEVVYKTTRGYDPAKGGDQERLVEVDLSGKAKDSLHLMPDTLTMALRGPTGGFTARIIPASASQEVHWSTLDSDFLEVSPVGILTARAVGLARVVAASKTRPSLADTAFVRILPEVPVDSVRLDRRLLDLFVLGAADSLIIRIYPPLAPPGVTLSVADSSVAGLNGGFVRGLKEGETWLRASSVANPRKQDSIPLTVFPAEEVDSVRLKEDTLRLYVNGESRALTARLYPLTLKPYFAWKSEEEAVARVDAEGRVTPLSAGQSRVVVKARADSMKQDQALILVKRDVPHLRVGGDTVIARGTTLTYDPLVVQEYGVVQQFKWDLDGNGVFEDSSTTLQSGLAYRYGEAREYKVRFYVRDTEGNDTVHIRVVKAVEGRVVQILIPRDGSFTKEASTLVTWNLDGESKTATERLAPGMNRIVRSAQDSAGTVYADTVFVYLDQTAPMRPVVLGPQGPVNTLTPRWSWRSGDTSQALGRGAGIYRLRLDDPDLSAATQVTDTVFTPATNLFAGTHTLFVQERDEAGNWSPSGSLAIVIDTTAPPAPSLQVSPESPTNNARPTWSWISGSGDGVRIYRYKLGDGDFRTGAKDTTGTRYQPGTALSEGVHTLYVQERDSAGNWSVTASKAITVDLTPPMPPTVSVGPAVLTNDATPTWTWSTSTVGAVTFRWRLDSADLTTGATEGTGREFTPASALAEGVHTLYVQERDAAGNWSLNGSRQVRIDVTPPTPPRIDSTPYSPLNSLRPRWTWRSGTGGAKVYRARVDTASLEATTEQLDSSIERSAAFGEGSHRLYVQERDSAGNWSVVVSRSLFLTSSGIVGQVGFSTGNRASIAVSKSGTPYVAYITGRDNAFNEAGNPSVKKFNGATWEDLPSTQIFGVNRIQVRVDANGTPYVAMAFASSSAWMFKIFYLSGLDWVDLNAPYLIASDGMFEFELGEDGTPYLAYKDLLGTSDSCLTFLQYRNGTWSPLGDVLANRGPFSVDFAPNGNAAVAIAESSTKQIHVWTLASGRWTSHGMIATNANGSTPQISMSGSGVSVLSYLGQGPGGLTFRVVSNASGGWKTVGTPSLFPTSGEILYRPPAMKFGNSGSLFAAWNAIWKLESSEWISVGSAFNFKPLSGADFAITQEGVAYSVIAGDYDGPISVWKSAFNP